MTGVNTFLGKNIVGLLEEDDSVSKIVILDIKNAPTASAKSSYYDVDLTQPGVDSRIAEIFHAERVDTLVHLAFTCSPTQATAWAHELESVGTMHLLNACQKQPPRRLVLRSSVLVYGPQPDNPNFMDEEHPTRGITGSHFVDDRLDVERQVASFAAAQPATSVIVLRMAPVLGAHMDNYVAKWLSRRVVPTVLGFDPLVQFVHEIDAVAAIHLAIRSDTAGVFNIVGEGVLPISTVAKLAGRFTIPLPFHSFRRLAALLWVAQLIEAPPSFVSCLRYLCVADGARAAAQLGFHPVYSTRDAVLDFEGALRQREARVFTREVA